MPVIVDLRTLKVLDEDLAERCLGRMVTEGSDSSRVRVDERTMRSAYAVAESAMAEGFQARLSSVRESYRLKINRKRALLDSAREKGQKVSCVRMLEGGIRNLESEQSVREATIERLRSVTAEHLLTAAGILQVV